MYSGSLSSHRFSPLAQLTPSNVSRLKPAWVYQPAGVGSVEATPIVADGVMYTTSGPTNVAALDLKSGRPLWEWNRPIAASVLNLGFPRVNRGVAILDGTVYVGTLDGYLVALDAKSGAERWSTQVGDNPHRSRHHRRAPRRRGQSHRRHQRRRSRDPRVPRRLRRENRQAGLALLDGAVAGRTRKRIVARRQLGPRRRRDVADRLVRSRDEAALLGHRQSWSRLERRLAQRRQPLHVLAGRDRHHDGKSALAFSIHAARRARLGCESGSRARRRRRPRHAEEARRDGEPQRLLLRAGPRYRRVPAWACRTRSRRGPRDSMRRDGRF